MKTIFTLILASLLCVCGLVPRAFGQTTILSESFTNDISLPANYPGWTFNTSAGALWWSSTQNNHTITNGTLIFDQLNGNGVTTASILTPMVTFVGGTVTISFNYDLHGNLSGGSYRKITVFLVDGVGNLTPFDSVTLTSALSGVQTFSSSKLMPSTIQRKVEIYLEGKSAGSAYLLFDNLNITYPFSVIFLPVKLASFQGNMDKNNMVTLQWQTAENETAGYFEVQRSSNGIDFTSIGTVMATDAAGAQNYQYSETVGAIGKTMYRLKMVDKHQAVSYSRILMFESNASAINNAIKIYGNPVTDKLTLSFVSPATQTFQVKVYDLNGHLRLNQAANCYQGDNMISLPLSSTFKPGLYVVEVNNGVERYITKFVKQ